MLHSLGILYGDTKAKADGYLKKLGSAYPTLFWMMLSEPTLTMVSPEFETFVIGRDGTIVKKYTGPVTKMELEVLLNGLLGK